MELLDDVCHMESRFGLFVVLDEEAQVEAWFGLFGDSANLDARLMHGLHGTYDMLRNQLGGT